MVRADVPKTGIQKNDYPFLSKDKIWFPFDSGTVP